MTSKQFLEELHLILGATPGTLTPESLLNDYSSWDSMGKMAAMTLIDSGVGVPVPSGLIDKCGTVGELIAFVAPHVKQL